MNKMTIGQCMVLNADIGLLMLFGLVLIILAFVIIIQDFPSKLKRRFDNPKILIILGSLFVPMIIFVGIVIFLRGLQHANTYFSCFFN